MKHIASVSFGKDSLAMLYIMKEHSIPIDEIVFVRIMFDDETSAEIPEHEQWIMNYAIPKIKKDFGLDVKIIQSDFTYLDLFNKEITRGKRKGQKRGFPLLFGSWCHRDLKIAPMQKYLKEKKDYVQYLGIASDEATRIDWALKQKAKLPLVDYGITEQQAFEICKKYNVLSPAYKFFNRLGCWFCHKQGNKALKKVIEMHEELFDKVIALDKKSHIKFKQNKTAEEIKYTIFDLEKKFERRSYERITATTSRERQRD